MSRVRATRRTGKLIEFMPEPAANLFLLEDLDDASRTMELADSDLHALRRVAEFTNTFVARPNKDLGRPGPVCPFVAGALENMTLWLAPEHAAGRSVAEVADLIEAYQRVFLDAPPPEDDANHKAIVVVFTDLPVDRAQALFDPVLEQIAVRSYVEDGFAMGGSFKGYEVPGIHNRSFRPFVSPVPFILIRHTVVDDWKFFLDSEEWTTLWSDHFGEAATEALAEKLRSLPWRPEPA